MGGRSSFVAPELPGGGARELLRRLQVFTADLSVAVTMRDVARVLLEQGLEHFGARAAGIVWMMQPGELRLVFGRGLTELEYRELDALSRAGARLPIRDAIRGRVSIWLETPDEIRARYPALEPLRARRGESGCAVVPLVLGDRCPGVIGFTFDRQEPFPEDERILIEALARLSAEAFERARLFEAEQQARRQAERAREALERVMAIVGHDLRTPIGAITGAADLIGRHGALAPAQRKALGLLRRSAERMARMIGDITDFSAVRSGLGLRVHLARTDLGLLAQRALQELGAEHAEGGGSVALDGDLGLQGDADRLMQLISNLAGNALQHGRGSGVQVEARGAGEEVRLVVRNREGHIPPDELPRIFDAFRRGARADEEGAGQGGEGLGLGLFIVREIVRAHGGGIEVRSSPEEGTAFEVVLPRRPAAGA